MAARPTWSGSITFGLLSISVKLYSATTSKDVEFHNVHAGCGSRLNQQMVCTAHGDLPTSVEKLDRERVYEYAKERYVAVSDADLASLPVPSRATISIDSFVDPAEIDPMYCEKTYWLEPDKAGAKPYALLTKALEAQDVLGVATITLRNRERLCTLRSVGTVLVLETLYWPDEVRALSSGNNLPQVDMISAPELDLACAIVAQAKQRFDASQYTDRYRTELLALIERKRTNPDSQPQVVVERTPEALDFMAALRATLEQQMRAKQEQTEVA